MYLIIIKKELLKAKLEQTGSYIPGGELWCKIDIAKSK